jgi:hypothetical protein
MRDLVGYGCLGLAGLYQIELDFVESAAMHGACHCSVHAKSRHNCTAPLAPARGRPKRALNYTL